MRTRDVVGKRIMKVEQERATDNAGRRYSHVAAIELEDGTRLTFDTVEMENGYGVEASVWRPKTRLK